jgi:hypothetical protein
MDILMAIHTQRNDIKTMLKGITCVMIFLGRIAALQAIILACGRHMTATDGLLKGTSRFSFGRVKGVIVPAVAVFLFSAMGALVVFTHCSGMPTTFNASFANAVTCCFAFWALFVATDAMFTCTVDPVCVPFVFAKGIYRKGFLASTAGLGYDGDSHGFSFAEILVKASPRRSSVFAGLFC